MRDVDFDEMLISRKDGGFNDIHKAILGKNGTVKALTTKGTEKAQSSPRNCCVWLFKVAYFLSLTILLNLRKCWSVKK